MVQVDFWGLASVTSIVVLGMWTLFFLIGLVIRIYTDDPHRTNKQNRATFLNTVAIALYFMLVIATFAFYTDNDNFWAQASPFEKEMFVYFRISLAIAWGVIIGGFLCKFSEWLSNRFSDSMTNLTRKRMKYENKNRQAIIKTKGFKGEYIITGWVAKETSRYWRIEDDEGRRFKIYKSRIGGRKYGVQSLDVQAV